MPNTIGRHPVFPIADTVAMINMDQVGRMQDDKLLAGGLGSAKSFETLIDRLNTKHDFRISKEMSGFAPSDNASFYRRKIPAVWFFTGFHEQYHRPTDRLETLNVPGLARIASLVGDVAQELASNSERPVYQKTGNFDRSKTLWSTAPSIGVVPRYGDKEEGVLVLDVYKGTAADRSGLEKGDRIRAVGETRIMDPLNFHVLSRTWKPGSKVDLVVDRAGKEEKVALVLFPPPGGFTDSMLGVIVDMGDFKKGLAVTGVVKDGPAAKAGLRKGDRIAALAGQPLQDRDAYFNVMRGLRPGETIPASIARGAMMMQFEITIAGKKNSP